MSLNFRDEFRQLPPPASMGDRDMRPLHGDREIREALRQISDLLRGLERRQFRDPDGNLWEFLGRTYGTAGEPNVGFLVRGAPDDPNAVTVSPSVVSGMGAAARVPLIGGDPLTDDPAPTLAVGINRWVALRIEVEPQAEIVWQYEDTTAYGVAEGGGAIVDEIEVRAYKDESEMQSVSRVAAVDVETGEVTQNGIFVVPLAWRDTNGAWHQIGYYGPLGCHLCRGGGLTVLSPARAPGVQIPIETEPA